MEQELLLKDLSARLPYEVFCEVEHKDSEGWKSEIMKLNGVYTDECYFINSKGSVYSNSFKPYLRPMSSMTEEEKKEYYTFQYKFTLQTHEYQELNKETLLEYLDWLNSHHFDYRGIIEKGLALEALEGMYS